MANLSLGKPEIELDIVGIGQYVAVEYVASTFEQPLNTRTLRGFIGLYEFVLGTSRFVGQIV